MPQKSHWPFGEEAHTSGIEEWRRSKQVESEKARLAEQSALQQRMRHDRLIVGGRAHTKKHGMS
jgi:hypothetical protein